VTLRSEIHAVIDDVVVANPINRAHVLAVAAAERRAEPGRGTRARTRRTRSFFSLGLERSAPVAFALIVLLLLGTVLVGGRLLRERESRAVQPAGIDQHVLDTLRARPLVLPFSDSSGQCPGGFTGTIVHDGGPYSWLGTGPVYLNGGSAYVNGVVPVESVETTGSRQYFAATLIVDTSVFGPVLVRGLDTMSRAPLVFVGAYGAGQPVATDNLAGHTVHLFREMAFESGAGAPQRVAGSTSDPEGTAGWGVWPFRLGVPAGFSNCFGLQIDGTSFSEVITGFGLPSWAG
jgi:hypothetical protein